MVFVIVLPHPQATVPRRRHESGFTLIELMIVVTLVGILLVIAIPSFRELIQRNRVAGEINSFVSDLQFARSEAIKRGQPVSLCASADGSTCLGTNTWNQGWIVFSDVNGSGARDNVLDVLLRVRVGWTSGDTFAASPTLSALTYGREGFAVIPGGTVTMPLRTAPLNSNATRCIAINRVGRQTVQSPGTGTCT